MTALESTQHGLDAIAERPPSGFDGDLGDLVALEDDRAPVGACATFSGALHRPPRLSPPCPNTTYGSAVRAAARL
jgi:hypothetical protein